MPLTNFLLIGQIASHVILFVLSLCIIVPLTFNELEFCGHCLLFATGKWREEDGMFDVTWASSGYCNFALCTGVVVLLAALGQIYHFARLKGEEQSFLSLFVDVVVGVVVLLMSILSAVMITFGFIVWCDGMTERFPSCEISAGQNIFRSDAEKIDTSGFYFEMGTAQFGAWGAFAVSVGSVVLAMIKLVDNHQVRNMKVSMYMERQRLVNQPQAQSDGRSTPPAEISAETAQRNAN